MRTLAAVIASALTLSVAAGPVLAQTTTPQKVGTTEPAKASPAKATTAHKRSATGEVVAVNADSKTLTIKRTEGSSQELAFSVDGKATKALAGVKTGDRVRVTYADASGQLTATSIVKTAHVTHTASAPKAQSK